MRKPRKRPEWLDRYKMLIDVLVGLVRLATAIAVAIQASAIALHAHAH